MRKAVLLVVACSSCSSSGQQQTSCAELNQYAPEGIRLGSNESECAQTLAFADTVQARYGMDFRTWLSTVLSQRSMMVEEAIYALIGQRSWTPQTFAQVPPELPCGGVPLTDDLWLNSPLSQILSMRPEHLYVALAIENPPTPGDMAAIRVYQDFNCDHVVGLMELVGEFHSGLPLLGGGWKLMSTTVPTIYE